MATLNLPQGRILVAASELTDVQTQQLRVLAAFNLPSEAIETQQLRLLVADSRPADLYVYQTRVLAAVAGRNADPRIRVWSSQLDGHEQYYLRLGDELTLVYDLATKEWSEYGHGDNPFWRVSVGCNWTDAQNLGFEFGSNIVVGDDVFGTLYFLDPRQPYDDVPNFALDQKRYFTRKVTGQLVVRGRETVPCYAVWMTTDVGDPAYEGASVNLEISDDAGHNYYSCGEVQVTAGIYSPELSWYSLGQITAPGRLFRFSDNGAVARIDTVEMQDPPAPEDDDKK